jgi:hypothetical protein
VLVDASHLTVTLAVLPAGGDGVGASEQPKTALIRTSIIVH